MRILTIDVGTGTQDILLYDSNKNLKNCVKLILPSPTRIVASKIKKATEMDKDIFLSGYTMGGGPCTFAIKEHIRAGKRVISLPKPALTFNDDLKRVKEMGVEVVEEKEERQEKNLLEIEMRDVMLSEFNSFFGSINVDLPEKIFVAVQDHGFSPKMSNRKFRFKVFERTVKEGNIYSFFYPGNDVPYYFNRMRSVVESIKDFGEENGFEFDVYVIDTVFAALIGAMTDARDFPAFILNFGNSHTIGAVVEKNGEIYSIFEHHTSILRKRGKRWIALFLKKFLNGEISNEDVFNDGGHGAFIKDLVKPKDFISIGPNTELSPYRIANLYDTMIAGNLGMIRAYGETGDG
ncbi:hypothetical protein DRP07_05970 [Archaeoglobales archaeon]|nr:MAG: hypothetical protein DRP07_05970 [Archaeoglobales archaeon]